MRCEKCGGANGFFRSLFISKTCTACADKETRIRDEVKTFIREAYANDTIGGLMRLVDKSLEGAYWINKTEILVDGWAEAFANATSDSVIDESEDRRLREFIKVTGIPTTEFDRNGFLTKLDQSLYLRELQNGNIVALDPVSMALPFVLQKSEKLVHVIDNVQYETIRTRTRRVGGSRGTSVRVAKGLWVRVGGFQSRPEEYDEAVYGGTGTLGMTTKHIYFHSEIKSFRIPYSKIVSLVPYADGFEVMKDNQTAKPQIFTLFKDAWFDINTLQKLMGQA